MKQALAFLTLLAVLSACAPASPAYLAPVEGYLVEEIGEANFGGGVFCAYEVLGVDLQAASTDVYVWALCAEYFLEDGALTMGTASSLPVALHLQQGDGQYRVIGHEIPGNGTDYWPSIQKIFPPKAIENMCEGNIPCGNKRLKRLERAVEEKAEEYYGVK